MSGKDIVPIKELDNVRSIADALAFFAQHGIEVENNELDGIRHVEIVDDKDKLIDVPFLLLQWRFNDGKFGVFVSAEILVETPRGDEVLILNDGSTGIAQQLRDLTDHREREGHPTPYAGRFVRGGLSRSDYTYTDEKGNETPASTYYLQY